MLMRGRWGFDLKELIREAGEMRAVTPGKWVSKKVGMVEGSVSSVERCEEGRKRVHVKEPSYTKLAL